MAMYSNKGGRDDNKYNRHPYITHTHEPAHYTIELIYVPTKVRAWGSVELDCLTLVEKKERTFFQVLLPPSLQLDNTF